jgi:hypothetical protein
MVISKPRYSIGLLLAVLLLLLPAVPAAAGSGARVYDLRVSVPIAGDNLLPPGPCREGIHLEGSVDLLAHVVQPPPVGDRSAMLVELHLNAEGMTGTGLTTEARYRGGQGNTATFKFDTSDVTFRFDGMVNLRLDNPNQLPPGPCRVPKTIDPCWFVTITQTDSGPRLSAVMVRLFSSLPAPPKS